MDKDKKIDDILKEFHSTIAKILKVCKKIEPNNATLHLLHNRISMVRDIDPLFIMHRCHDKMWIYRKEILEENEDFFMHNKFDQYIKNDDNRTFMFSLIDLLKQKIPKLNMSEKKELWKLIQNMLESVIKYKMIVSK